MWNMQSGKERRSFPQPILGRKTLPQTNPSTQLGTITGLATDAINTRAVASALDGSLYVRQSNYFADDQFFDFHSAQLHHHMRLPSSISALCLQRDSGLLCCICDDLIIRLVDLETRRIVRELRGAKGRILDAAFSSDSRWLITTALDSVIRTYDIPTGRLVDAFCTPSIATSLTLSPTGDFLATAHMDNLGVHLWANRAQFSDVPLQHINEEDDVLMVELPLVEGADADLGIDEDVGAPEPWAATETIEPLSSDLVTLSFMPRSKWQTLLNLDTIRARNKPKEPPKAPEAAPFFLPTLPGLETRFDIGEKATEPAANMSGVRLSDFESEFTRRLSTVETDQSSFFDYMKALPPSALDLEIRSIISLEHLGAMIRVLLAQLQSHQDFEAMQAILSVFLAVHADVLLANEELRPGLARLKAAQEKESGRLLELVSYALGTLSFLRGQ